MPRGYNAFADVLVTKDGQDLNALFDEVRQAVDARNTQRLKFIDLLTYHTTNVSEDVLQWGDSTDVVMEEASEYGVPVGIRNIGTLLKMGAPLKWYDAATKFTYRALASMTAAQVQAITNLALEADNKLMYTTVMKRLLSDQSVQFTEDNITYNAYAFWNGDGSTPSSYNGNTFSGTHTHFRTSGAATVDSGDLNEIIADFKSHGFSAENDTQIVVLVNPIQGATIRGFRVSSGAAEDFIPAQGARFFTNDHLLGNQPAAKWGDWAVSGGYGEALIIEDTRIPAGYIVGLASGGTNVPTNPIMLREHWNKTGLQIIPGNNANYPLIDSYFTHAVGAGVRQRGAGLVMQVTANATYAAPTSITG